MRTNDQPKGDSIKQVTHHDIDLFEGLDDNLAFIRDALGNSPDLITRVLDLHEGTRIALLHIDGLVNNQILHQSVLASLMHPGRTEELAGTTPTFKLAFLKRQVIIAADVEYVKEYNKLLDHLLSGDIIVLLDGVNDSLRIGAPGWKDRNVGEPSSQAVVRGPMEGFTENLRTNTALLRRRIKDSRLWMENYKIGKVSHTNVTIAYMHDIANESVVQEVRDRLRKIDTDSILESGYIEEFIQDSAMTPFPTMYNSDRPDTIAGGVLEGRVAILVDGTPFVLLVPAFLVSFFQSAEDYYQRWGISTLLRQIRFMAFLITLLAPSLYVAITTYHQEMIPTNLVISLAAQRERVPFPAMIEAVLMEVTYEILREAGVRIPKNVGQAISIVGTLVIGQAAVDAGFISSAMVIIVSITAISSFVIPETGMSIAVRMLRFVFMGLAGFMGLYGIMFGMFILILHIASLSTFGMPYTSPIGPYVQEDMKDSIFRFSWPKLTTRPKQNKPQNLARQSDEKRRGAK